MRNLCSFCLIALLFTAFLPQSLSAQKGSIVCKVMDFESGDGNLEITLYDKEKGFPEELEYSVNTKNVKVNGRDVVVIRWDNLPMGTYAIAGHHDANSNGEMDYNWIGMPKEGYCFSRDAKPVLSAPSFDDTKFKLDKELVTVYIHMQN